MSNRDFFGQRGTSPFAASPLPSAGLGFGNSASNSLPASPNSSQQNIQGPKRSIVVSHKPDFSYGGYGPKNVYTYENNTNSYALTPEERADYDQKKRLRHIGEQAQQIIHPSPSFLGRVVSGIKQEDAARAEADVQSVLRERQQTLHQNPFFQSLVEHGVRNNVMFAEPTAANKNKASASTAAGKPQAATKGGQKQEASKAFRGIKATGSVAPANKKDDEEDEHTYTNLNDKGLVDPKSPYSASRENIAYTEQRQAEQAAKAEKDKADAQQQITDESQTSSKDLYQYMFLMDTLAKIKGNPAVAANMDPAAVATLEAMVQSKSQEMLAKAVGSYNADQLQRVQQEGVGWTAAPGSVVAPGAAANIMRNMYLPQMAQQHRHQIENAKRNPMGMGMPVSAYVNMPTQLQAPGAAAVQKAPTAGDPSAPVYVPPQRPNTGAPTLSAAPQPAAQPAPQFAAAPQPAPNPYATYTGLASGPSMSLPTMGVDPSFMASAQGFSPFDSTPYAGYPSA